MCQKCHPCVWLLLSRLGCVFLRGLSWKAISRCCWSSSCLAKGNVEVEIFIFSKKHRVSTLFQGVNGLVRYCITFPPVLFNLTEECSKSPWKKTHGKLDTVTIPVSHLASSDCYTFHSRQQETNQKTKNVTFLGSAASGEIAIQALQVLGLLGHTCRAMIETWFPPAAPWQSGGVFQMSRFTLDCEVEKWTPAVSYEAEGTGEVPSLSEGASCIFLS